MTEGVDVREFVEVAGVVSAATVAALGEAATDKADVDVVVEADDFGHLVQQRRAQEFP